MKEQSWATVINFLLYLYSCKPSQNSQIWSKAEGLMRLSWDAFPGKPLVLDIFGQDLENKWIENGPPGHYANTISAKQYVLRHQTKYEAYNKPKSKAILYWYEHGHALKNILY